MGAMREIIRKLETIEEDFFEIDKTTNTAVVRFEYETPEDVFDPTINSKTPVMSSDFLESSKRAIMQVPDKYKIRIDVAFDDLEGWSEDDLADISRKNLLFLLKSSYNASRSSNRLAISLALTGLIFIILSILLGQVWSDGSFFHSMVLYMLDIVATVPFWGAMDICFIENREKRRTVINMARRYDSIVFHQKKPAE